MVPPTELFLHKIIFQYWIKYLADQEIKIQIGSLLNINFKIKFYWSKGWCFRCLYKK